MKVGDLVAYVEEIIDPEVGGEVPSQGIIIDGPWDTKTPPTRRYEIVWYTCGNKGWWEEKNLEILSESR
jgi:hypothetical protein